MNTMKTNDMFEKVQTILAKQLRIDASKITMDSLIRGPIPWTSSSC